MQKEIEQRALSLLKDPKVFEAFLKQGITPECFLVFTEVYGFISKYFHQYNSTPSTAIVSSSFPEFAYVDNVKPEELKFLGDELIKGNVQRKAVKILNDAQDILLTDPYGAVDSTISKLSRIRRKSLETRSYTDKDALNRYEYVVQNREKISRGISIGIKTGISLFDDKYIGWQPGHFIVVAGRLGIGKSWVIMYLGCTAYRTGKRILYLSPEMPLIEVELRWDTIMGQSMGHTFKNDKLAIGEINLREYKEYLSETAKRNDWLTIDSNYGTSFNINTISGMVDEFSPDMLIIDGIGLIESPGNSNWEKVKYVCDGIKKMAQNKKIVVVVSSQVNREAGNDMPTLTQISYGDSILQTADVGIMMSQDLDKPDIRYITIPKVRSGKAINKKVEIRFKVNDGIISI